MSSQTRQFRPPQQRPGRGERRRMRMHAPCFHMFDSKNDFSEHVLWRLCVRQFRPTNMIFDGVTSQIMIFVFRISLSRCFGAANLLRIINRRSFLLRGGRRAVYARIESQLYIQVIVRPKSSPSTAKDPLKFRSRRVSKGIHFF